MIRRWFAVVLMAWVSLASLFAFAVPTAEAAGETYTFASATTITSSANFTFTGSGNTFAYNSPCGPARFQSGIAHYTVTVGAKKTGGGYDGTIATVIGGSCPGVATFNGAIQIGDDSKFGPGGGSPSAAAAAAADPTDSAPQCDAGQAVFTWIICGAIRTIVDVVDWIRDNIIVPFLVEKPLDQKDPNVAPVFLIWTAFRNIASVFFILIFFMVIFGTAIGWDNYTVKKILPRLVLGAVLVPFSWYVCALVIDLGNVLGQGLVALTSSVIPPANIDFTSSISKIFLGGTIALGVAGAATALATVSLGVLVSILIAFLMVFFTLVLRKILIILLVVISPFAFLAWILPNTSKWFKEWWDNFFKLVLMYPVVMMLFEAGRLFAATAGATAGNSLENGVTPLFQIVGLTLPLFGVPFAFSWAGKGLKAGQGAIGKVAGAADKRFGKDSAMAKDRAETRKANNARRALDSSNRIGGEKIGFDSKTLGALKRAGALKRSGYGGFTSNIPGYGKIPMISKPMNAAAKQKLNSAEAKAKSDLAQSAAYDKMRKEQPKTSKQSIADQSEAALTKLKDERKNEELRSYKTKDKEHGGTHSSNGVAMGDIDLNKDEGIKDLQSIATEAYAEGNMSRVAAALTRLSQSNGGIDGAQELAMGRIGEYKDKDGKTRFVGGNGFNGTDENGNVTFDADGNAQTHGRSLLGGEYGQIGADGKARTARNASDENLEMWRDGMKGAKGFDVNKPIPAGATDISADEIAGEHHTAIKRRLAYADQASHSTDARTQNSGIQSAKDFGEAAELIAKSQILTGKVASKSKDRLAQAGTVFVPNAPGAASYVQPVVAPGVANQFAAMIQPAPPPSAIPSGTASHIVAATGKDITQVANITEHITNEIKTTGKSVTQANIENHILEHGSIDSAGLAAAGAPVRPIGPMTAAEAAYRPPEQISAHIADKFKDNLDAIHAIERRYTDPANHDYRAQVNRNFLTGAPIVDPRTEKPAKP